MPAKLEGSGRGDSRKTGSGETIPARTVTAKRCGDPPPAFVIPRVPVPHSACEGSATVQVRKAGPVWQQALDPCKIAICLDPGRRPALWEDQTAVISRAANLDEGPPPGSQELCSLDVSALSSLSPPPEQQAQTRKQPCNPVLGI